MIILAVNGRQSKFGRRRLIDSISVESCNKKWEMARAYVTTVTRKKARNECRGDRWQMSNRLYLIILWLLPISKNIIYILGQGVWANDVDTYWWQIWRAEVYEKMTNCVFKEVCVFGLGNWTYPEGTLTRNVPKWEDSWPGQLLREGTYL